MAALADVETALQALIYAPVYPNAAPPSALGYPVLIYAGWPDPATLDKDLAETSPGVPTTAHISIYPLPTERNVTRFPIERIETPALAPAYTLSVAGQVITVGGSPPSPYRAQNLAVFVNGEPYVYQATSGQTASQAAAALQALIVADIAGTTVTGPAITLPAGARIGALRVGGAGSTLREVRRQEKQFQVSIWTSSPGGRDALLALFDPVMADTPFLTLADGSQARLLYKGSRTDDFIQKQRIYRHIAIWCVEYATTIRETATEIVVATENLDDALGDVIQTASA